MEVYGTISNPSTTFVAPGKATSLYVSNDAVPYVVNTKGDIYKKDKATDAWEQVGGSNAFAS